MTFPLDITYTADWDGQWLTVVAEISDSLSRGQGLRSTAVLDPTRCNSAAGAARLLMKNEFIPETDIVQGRFKVTKTT